MVGDHSRLVFLPDRQLKLMKAQKFCVSESRQGGSQRPCVVMSPTFLFKQYCTLPSVCYSSPKEMRQSYEAQYLWIFFHLIRNVQKRQMDGSKTMLPACEMKIACGSTLGMHVSSSLMLVFPIDLPFCEFHFFSGVSRLRQIGSIRRHALI